MRISPWISCVLFVVAGCATVPAVPPATPEVAAPGAPAVTDGLPSFALTLASQRSAVRRTRPEPIAPIGTARAPDPVLAPLPVARPVLSSLCGMADDLRLQSSADREETRSRTAALVLSIENPDPGCRSAEAFLHTVSLSL